MREERREEGRERERERREQCAEHKPACHERTSVSVTYS